MIVMQEFTFAINVDDLRSNLRAKLHMQKHVNLAYIRFYKWKISAYNVHIKKAIY